MALALPEKSLHREPKLFFKKIGQFSSTKKLLHQRAEAVFKEIRAWQMSSNYL
jgi:hypothetical protein